MKKYLVSLYIIICIALGYGFYELSAYVWNVVVVILYVIIMCIISLILLGIKDQNEDRKTDSFHSDIKITDDVHDHYRLY